MTADFALDGLVVVFLLAVGGWTIFARRSFAAVVGFVVYGLVLTLAWVRLGSVDVALTEAAIGSGLTGALLLGALRSDASDTSIAADAPGLPMRVMAAGAAGLVTVALAATVLMFPEPAPTLAPAAAQNVAATGLANPVTGVLMAFRAMDTMLEKFVLLIALISVWSLAPDALWGGRPGQRRPGEPQGLIAFLARLLVPVGVLVGVYVLWAGADRPGGAFQGGTILAAMWLLLTMAGLADNPRANDGWLRVSVLAGPAVFLIVGLGGLVAGSAFLAYPVAYAKPIILAIEFVMTATVAVTLALLLAGPSARGPSS